MPLYTGMYAQVKTIPPNKDYVVLRTQQGQTMQFPRQYAQHVRVGDVGELGTYNNRPCIKLLTDVDDVVIMNQPSHQSMAPVPTPAAIPTP